MTMVQRNHKIWSHKSDNVCIYWAIQNFGLFELTNFLTHPSGCICISYSSTTQMKLQALKSVLLDSRFFYINLICSIKASISVETLITAQSKEKIMLSFQHSYKIKSIDLFVQLLTLTTSYKRIVYLCKIKSLQDIYLDWVTMKFYRKLNLFLLQSQT